MCGGGGSGCVVTVVEVGVCGDGCGGGSGCVGVISMCGGGSRCVVAVVEVGVWVSSVACLFVFCYLSS